MVAVIPIHMVLQPNRVICWDCEVPEETVITGYESFLMLSGGNSLKVKHPFEDCLSLYFRISLFLYFGMVFFFFMSNISCENFLKCLGNLFWEQDSQIYFIRNLTNMF